MKLLIVEDEEHLAFGLKFNFEAEGYEVTLAAEGATAMTAFEDAQADKSPFSLIILDLMLPEMSGYEICQKIREQHPSVPILVLSARTLSEDKARAFDCGCDQYVTKPFDLSELLSRVRNLTSRRAPPAEESTIDETAVHGAVDGTVDGAVGDEWVEFGRARVNFRTFEATVDDQSCNLTTMELQLVRYFLDHEGAVLTRANILENVWEIHPAPTTRTVDNFVMRLRRHFEVDPSKPKHFLSVRGAGYRFVRDP